MSDGITYQQLVDALERIELLTATGTGLDPHTTMEVHLLAGIGRATHDRHAWYAEWTANPAAFTEETQGEALAMRCAECDCPHGGACCNWIKSPGPCLECAKEAKP